MDTQNVVYTYNGILAIKRNEVFFLKKDLFSFERDEEERERERNIDAKEKHQLDASCTRSNPGLSLQPGH